MTLKLIRPDAPDTQTPPPVEPWSGAVSLAAYLASAKLPKHLSVEAWRLLTPLGITREQYDHNEFYSSVDIAQRMGHSVGFHVLSGKDAPRDEETVIETMRRCVACVATLPKDPIHTTFGEALAEGVAGGALFNRTLPMLRDEVDTIYSRLELEAQGMRTGSDMVPVWQHEIDLAAHRVTMEKMPVTRILVDKQHAITVMFDRALCYNRSNVLTHRAEDIVRQSPPSPERAEYFEKACETAAETGIMSAPLPTPGNLTEETSLDIWEDIRQRTGNGIFAMRTLAAYRRYEAEYRRLRLVTASPSVATRSRAR